MKNKPSFSLFGSRKWMSDKHDSDLTNFFNIEESEKSSREEAGKLLKPRIKDKEKLSRKIKVSEGDKEEIAEEFIEKGGILLEEKGDNYLVEVSCGCFYIAKICIKN